MYKTFNEEWPKRPAVVCHVITTPVTTPVATDTGEDITTSNP